MRYIINSLLASMLLLASCTTNADLGISPAPISEPFYASIEDSTTRTYVSVGDKLLWSAGDRVTVFNGNTTPLEYQFAGDDGAASGALNPVSPASVDSGSALSANYAIYPHSASTTITDEGLINYTIPATQTYAENSFGLGANVMVAVTENKDDRNLEFKNVGGYFEFSLYGEGVTVRSIVFSGNNGEKLAGNVSITATHNGTPSVAFADDATTMITLDCGEGVELSEDENNPTKFWFVVPAITYEDGITITITDTEGKVMEKTTENRIAIERSTVQPLAAFEVETISIPKNQIWYTSTDGERVTPNRTNVFGANIVSNVYYNGKGIITFDGNVTSIDYNAFWGCRLLESITLPEGVTSIGDSAFYDCSSLTSIAIPDSVESIGSYAFGDCYSLTSITIPNGVTSIGNNAFNGCSSLMAFYGKYASADNRCWVVDGKLLAFAPAGLTSYTIPNGVTSVGGHTFRNCDALECITLPEGVASIGDMAFYGCDALERITLPDSAISIGISSFSACDVLTAFYGKYATEDNRCWIVDGALLAFAPAGLTSYTVPIHVTSIGNGVFKECSSLVTIYCRPTTPPALDMNAFTEAPLSNIYVPISSVSAYKAAGGWSNYASIIEGYDFSN